MKRKRKARIPSAFRLSSEAHQAIGKICKVWGISRTRAVERAAVFAAGNRQFNPIRTEAQDA